MAVLFAVGVMNMLWVLLITIFVVLEKIGPVSSKYLRAVTGLIMVVWGGYWLSLYPW
jgi:predicted metal-binding membrane protein